jgi:hypothetical protein
VLSTELPVELATIVLPPVDNENRAHDCALLIGWLPWHASLKYDFQLKWLELRMPEGFTLIREEKPIVFNFPVAQKTRQEMRKDGSQIALVIREVLGYHTTFLN